MNWTPFIPEEDEFRISFTGCIADAAANEGGSVDYQRSILRERPLNGRRRRARRAAAADAVLSSLLIVVIYANGTVTLKQLIQQRSRLSHIAAAGKYFDFN